MTSVPRTWPRKHGSPYNAPSAALDIIARHFGRRSHRGRYVAVVASSLYFDSVVKLAPAAVRAHVGSSTR